MHMAAGSLQQNRIKTILQIAFTYIGTIVGAGFSTGQEILQFFSRFGGTAAITVGLAAFLFTWLGTKVMLMANELGTVSYEALNRHLFGESFGRWVSLITLAVLFGITAIMLAGAGTLFSENLGLPFQLGLLVTLALAYAVIIRGMRAIITINSIVVPILLCFSAIVFLCSTRLPHAAQWIHSANPHSLERAWISPFLYAAFNLATAQAVLVPLGGKIQDRQAIRWGGICGGIGIGLLLLSSHFAISAQMPEISRYEIPMAQIVAIAGKPIQWMYLAVIYCEIFTTLIGNIYGITLQLELKWHMRKKGLLIGILCSCYAVSLAGFTPLLSVLYPLFGLVSLVWFWRMVLRRRSPG